MRRIQQVRPPAVQHRPPARRRRLNAESEKAEGGLRENGASHAECRLHRHGGERRRDDMLDEDPRRVGAERPRRLDELELARAENLTANEARVPDPSNQR